jgi:hypothetical protein
VPDAFWFRPQPGFLARPQSVPLAVRSPLEPVAAAVPDAQSPQTCAISRARPPALPAAQAGRRAVITSSGRRWRRSGPGYSQADSRPGCIFIYHGPGRELTILPRVARPDRNRRLCCSRLSVCPRTAVWDVPDRDVGNRICGPRTASNSQKLKRHLPGGRCSLADRVRRSVHDPANEPHNA